MIAYEIFKGATAEDLGMPEANYRSRKETLNRFLLRWRGEDSTFKRDYLVWLSEENKKHPAPSHVGGPDASLQVEEEFGDLTYAEMFRGLGESIKAIAASGMKLAGKEAHSARYGICLECDKLENGRCKACGCFMKLKTKFGAMSCPLNKW